MLGPTLQKTTEASEAFYLMIKHCFEELGYLRVEWESNALNESSRRAAERLGFTFEGIMRKHKVVKGKGRDTAWYGMTDDDWFRGGRKEALKRWLDEKNFDEEGKQKRKLEHIREETLGVEEKSSEKLGNANLCI